MRGHVKGSGNRAKYECDKDDARVITVLTVVVCGGEPGVHSQSAASPVCDSVAVRCRRIVTELCPVK